MKDCNKLCCTKITGLGVPDILYDINIHVHCGEITAVIGRNGAGKSTLLKAITGEIKSSGKIEYVGENGKTRPIIGYVPQSLSFDGDCPATVEDLFRSCKASVDSKRAHLALISAGAEKMVHKRLSEMSGGELQRTLLALALVPVPNLLLLDEPVSGVDRNGTELFWSTLKQLRREFDVTIIIVSHSLSQVKKYADRAVLLNKRILISGTPEQVFASAEFAGEFDNV